MSAFSDYLEGSIINATLRGGTYTGGLVYVALFTANPTDTNVTANELDDSGYTRVCASGAEAASAGFSAPHATNGSTANAKAITFPSIVDGTVTVTHWGIYDASTAGNLLYHASLTNAKSLDAGDILNFPIGSLTITLA